MVGLLSAGKCITNGTSLLMQFTCDRDKCFAHKSDKENLGQRVGCETTVLLAAGDVRNVVAERPW